jgi:hypothetical protein
VAFAGARKLRLILDVGIKLARCLPERAERPLAAGVIPNARGYDTKVARRARHLAKSRDGVCHEVNDELCQSGVEGLIFKRQLLRRSASHGDAGMALSSCSNERRRRIDRRHRVRSQPPDQLGRQRAWAAADIEHSLTSGHRREIGERAGERH